MQTKAYDLSKRDCVSFFVRKIYRSFREIFIVNNEFRTVF